MATAVFEMTGANRLPGTSAIVVGLKPCYAVASELPFPESCIYNLPQAEGLLDSIVGANLNTIPAKCMGVFATHRRGDVDVQLSSLMSLMKSCSNTRSAAKRDRKSVV